MTASAPAPDGEEPESRPPRSELTPRQRELLDELTALDPWLAGLYRQGVRLALEVHEPGAAHLLAHVGRELTLGVVDAPLEEGWSLSERELAEIPDNEQHRGKIARSLGLNPSDRRVTQWFELHNTFVAATHYRRGGPPPSADELRLSFQRLEQLLYGRVGPYFQTQAELDGLLGVGEPDYRHVERLQAVLLRPQQRRYFFGKLANPAWIAPLDRIGTFSNPPERRVYPDGSWRVVPWPEGEFLARVAADNAELVAAILERLPSKIENPAVWRVVVEAANQVPPELARRLVPNLERATGNVLPVIFADGLLELVARLAEAGHPEGFDLARALLFVPSARDVGDVPPYTSRSGWLFPRMDWTEFSDFTERALPALERADPERTLKLLLAKLVEGGAVLRKLDLTRLLRSGHRPRGRPDPEDVAGQFLEAASQVMSRFASSGPENARRVLEMLAEHENEWFSILRYRLIATAGAYLEDELDALISSNLAVEPESWGREIALIVREQYQHASDPARRIFRYALQRGPDPETVRHMLSFREIEQPRAEDIDDVKRSWQRKRLTWFRGEIPDELRDLADRLGVWRQKPSIEEQELAEVGVYSGGAGAWGEPRPYAREDLSGRSAQEIARLIAEWQPGERPFETGTIRGFHLSVRELAVENPGKVLELWQLAGDELPPGFAESILDGLRDGLKGRPEGLDWSRALACARTAVKRATASEGSESMRQSLLRSVTDLIEEGAQNDLLPLDLEGEVWAILTTAAIHVVTWQDEDEAIGSFDRLFTAALSHAASRVLQTALHVGLWSYGARKKASVAEAGTAAEQHLTPILDAVWKRAGSVRAKAETVVGQFLPGLELMVPHWLQDHLFALMDLGATEPLEHPAWGAYLTRARFFDSTFKVLRPWYVKAAEAAATPAGRVSSDDRDWSLTRSLAEHVLIAVLRGLSAVGDTDQLVEMTFRDVPASERGRAYWGIFRAWSDAEQPPPDSFVQHLLAFWEWRLGELERGANGADVVAEARELGWFLRMPYLPDGHVLRLGLRTAEVAKGQLETHIDWDRFRDLAATDVDVTYEIAELVLQAELSKDHHFVPVNEVKAVLQVALQLGSPDTKSRAWRLVNRLGEVGYGDFGELL